MAEVTNIDDLITKLTTELQRIFSKYNVSVQDSEEIYFTLEEIDNESGIHKTIVEDLKKQAHKAEEEKQHILSEIDTVSTTVLAAHKLLNSVCTTTEKIVKRKQGDHTL